VTPGSPSANAAPGSATANTHAPSAARPMRRAP
jgi:hypothetical protein